MSGSSSTVTPVTPIPSVPEIPEIEGIEGLPKVPPIAPVSTSAPGSPPPPIKNSEAVPYFLKEVNDSNLLYKRGPAVDVEEVVPFIDGDAIFRELETAIKNAKSSILMAFWMIDPSMKLLTDKSSTWGELLLKKAKENVMVRVLWSNFDPALAVEEHRTSWTTYMEFIKILNGYSGNAIEILCALHESEVSALMAGSALPKLYDNLPAALEDWYLKLLQKSKRKLTDAQKKKEMGVFLKEHFDRSPGLWDKIEFDTSTSKLKVKTPGKDYAIFPLSHHKKTIIIDGAIAYTGGVNIREVYSDTSKHIKKKRTDTTMVGWHDSFVRIKGSYILPQFIASYVGLWNQERTRAEAFLKNAYAANKLLPQNISLYTRPTSAMSVAAIATSASSTVTGSIPGQVRRTISRGSFSLSVKNVSIRKDILEGYKRAIELAEDFIYIESQYFREKEIADAIIKRHTNKNALRFILLLPDTAEELLKANPDVITLHGAFLQHSLISKLENALKANFGVFSLNRSAKEMVYVHSKLMIVDDKWASIGSANANPRGFNADTELDFVWYDSKSVTDLRIKLWEEYVGVNSGMRKWKATQFVEKWKKIAEKNKKSPAKRNGMAWPFNNKMAGTEADDRLDIFT